MDGMTSDTGMSAREGMILEGCVYSEPHRRSAEIKPRCNLDHQLRLERPAGSGPSFLGAPGVTDSLGHEGIPFVAALQLMICQNTEL